MVHLNILTLRERLEVKDLVFGLITILHRPGNSESYREKGMAFLKRHRRGQFYRVQGLFRGLRDCL